MIFYNDYVNDTSLIRILMVVIAIFAYWLLGRVWFLVLLQILFTVNICVRPFLWITERSTLY
jgi:hypothetical protein